MQTSVLVLLAIAAAVSVALAVEIRFYSQTGKSSNRHYKKFTFADAQVCYSLDSCYSNLAVFASWSGAPTGAKFAFFDGSECSGQAIYMGDSKPKAGITFSKVDFSKKTSSFMMLQWSQYPVAGLRNICYESTELSTGMTTNTSML